MKRASDRNIQAERKRKIIENEYIINDHEIISSL